MAAEHLVLEPQCVVMSCPKTDSQQEQASKWLGIEPCSHQLDDIGLYRVENQRQSLPPRQAGAIVGPDPHMTTCVQDTSRSYIWLTEA